MHEISLERRAIALSAVATLTPVVIAGVWTPIAHDADKQVQMGALAVVALAATALATVAFRWLVRRIPKSFDGRARAHRVWSVLWLITALAAFAQTTRLSLFMADPTRTEASMVPGNEFLERHTCFSAYVHGAKLASEGAESVYVMPYEDGDDPLRTALPPDAEYLGHFTLDPYGYPPPFLLLPRAMLALTRDFTSLRALWFLLNALTAAASLGTMVWWIEERAAHQLVKLAPLLWASMPVLLSLQLGNAQMVVVLSAALAMIAFARKRHLLGGSLLSFVAISKFAPGLLGVVLLAQRRYRAAAVAAVAGGAWIGLSFLVLGAAPWDAFVHHHLPAIQDGTALSFLDDNSQTIAGNYAVFGLPFKLAALGIGSGGWTAARHAANAYSVLAIAAAWWLGRRIAERDRATQLCAWLAIVTLGALRSPFAPGHVLFGAALILCLVSRHVRSIGQRVALVATWLMLTVIPPLPTEEATLALSLMRQLVLVGMLAWVVAGRTAKQARPLVASRAI